MRLPVDSFQSATLAIYGSNSELRVRVVFLVIRLALQYFKLKKTARSTVTRVAKG